MACLHGIRALVFGVVATASPVAVLVAAPAAAWAEAVHVAIQVNEQDPAVMNLALNNAANILKNYSDLGQEVDVEVVAFGPGLHMLRSDTSPVTDRISTMSLENENLRFSACANTIAAMKKQSGADVPLLSEAVVVPSGTVRLIELQGQGYAYLRP